VRPPDAQRRPADETRAADVVRDDDLSVPPTSASRSPLVRGILDRPRPVAEEAERQRRRRELTDWYADDPERTADFVAFLEAQDRRRAAARRLPAVCGDDRHDHGRSGCRDPLLGATG